MNNPELVMMGGLPASGKSTYIKQLLSGKNYIVISTDKFLEKWAAEQNKTYNEIFSNNIKTATKMMNEELKMAVNANLDIIWDQTNLNVITRARKLAAIPNNYIKKMIWLNIPENWEWEYRLQNRKGKTIPYKVLQSMKESIEIPSIDEGFHSITIIG